MIYSVYDGTSVLLLPTGVIAYIGLMFFAAPTGADLLIVSISVFVFGFSFYYCGRLIYSYYLLSRRHSE